MCWLVTKNVLFSLLFFVGACSQLDENPKKIPQKPDPISLGKRFVDDSEFRRTLLVESFVDPENGYSQLRDENYGPRKPWETLEVWNPDVRPLTNQDDNNPFAPFQEIDIETLDENQLRAIGKEAFEHFPLGIDLQLESHILDPGQVGLWVSNSKVGGLVQVSLPSGIRVAPTCSTCHANVKDGKLTYGLANSDFEYGRVVGTDWGHGTVDVTPDGRNNPTSIPDIRPIRFQAYLHWTATLKNTLGALAVRIETLFITSLSNRLRPPRAVAFALAYYFWTLSEEGQGLTKSRAEEEPGFVHFKNHCISCHFLDGRTGSPIDLKAIGTTDAVGTSSRGTGKYRTPSLLGVSSRGRFLHDASIQTLEEFLDPKRLERVPGHVFGLSLSENERNELLDFLDLL